MRKLFGYFFGLFILIIYILLIVRLGDAIFPMHAAVEMLFYAVTGLIWIFPAMWFIRWWYKPKQPNNQ
ncbi:MAG: DUF2842 domain-containing protein [Emcibacter sp.]|nr:DUF2842 domain-containing protein [Emcibacter sp.]PCJ32096.1 MAG: hypothetical protein COA93_09970 [Alphaproteobacteria bacterium]